MTPPLRSPRMSSSDTRQLIAQAVDRFYEQVPALRNLALVIRLDLRAKGGPQAWRVEVPGPKISKDPAADARLEVEVLRQDFNKLVDKGTLRDWQKAYDTGHVNVSGEPAIVKLLGNVVERQLTRAR
jgi:hypothetical protein